MGDVDESQVFFFILTNSIIDAKRIKMSSSQNKMTKNLSNYGAFVSGWWMETDTFVIEKRENLLKENFLIELYLIVMRKGWWQENSWLMGWENFVCVCVCVGGVDSDISKGRLIESENSNS